MNHQFQRWLPFIWLPRKIMTVKKWLQGISFSNISFSFYFFHIRWRTLRMMLRMGWGEGNGMNVHRLWFKSSWEVSHGICWWHIQWHICQKWKQSERKEKKKIKKVKILGVFLSLMFDHFFFFCIFKWKFVPLCTSSSFVFCTTSEILTSATFKMFLRNTNLCDDKKLGERINFLMLFCGGRGA